MYKDADAEVLETTARRLISESAEAFRRSHLIAMQILESADPQLNRFREAVDRESRVIAIQREAFEMQRAAWRLRNTDWDDLSH